MKVSMTQANFERNLAIQQVNRLKQEIDQLSRDRHAVRIIHCSADVYVPCGLWGCKNGPAPFPGRMSYKVTKPGLLCLSYLSMLYYCILLGPLFMYC